MLSLPPNTARVDDASALWSLVLTLLVPKLVVLPVDVIVIKSIFPLIGDVPPIHNPLVESEHPPQDQLFPHARSPKSCALPVDVRFT